MATLQHFESGNQTPYVNITVDDNLTESEYLAISDPLRDESKETVLRQVLQAGNPPLILEQA